MRLLLLAFTFFFYTEISAQENYIYENNLISLNLLSTTVPIIEGELNGKKAFFIVDTGSTITVLDILKRKYFGFSIYKNISKKLHGFGGKSLKLWLLFDTHLKLGGKLIATNYTGTPLNKLKDSILETTGYEISGVLGSDVIRDYGIIVDYVNLRCLIGVGKDNGNSNEKKSCIVYEGVE